LLQYVFYMMPGIDRPARDHGNRNQLYHSCFRIKTFSNLPTTRHSDAHAAVHPFNQRFFQEAETHIAAISLYFMYYTSTEFTKHCGSLGRAWDVEGIVRLVEAEEAEQEEQSKTYYGAALGHESLR
jgi:hypothetical protein